MSCSRRLDAGLAMTMASRTGRCGFLCTDRIDFSFCQHVVSITAKHHLDRSHPGAATADRSIAKRRSFAPRVAWTHIDPQSATTAPRSRANRVGGSRNQRGRCFLFEPRHKARPERMTQDQRCPVLNWPTSSRPRSPFAGSSQLTRKHRSRRTDLGYFCGSTIKIIPAGSSAHHTRDLIEIHASIDVVRIRLISHGLQRGLRTMCRR